MGMISHSSSFASRRTEYSLWRVPSRLPRPLGSPPSHMTLKPARMTSSKCAFLDSRLGLACARQPACDQRQPAPRRGIKGQALASSANAFIISHVRAAAKGPHKMTRPQARLYDVHTMLLPPSLASPFRYIQIQIAMTSLLYQPNRATTEHWLNLCSKLC